MVSSKKLTVEQQIRRNRLRRKDRTTFNRLVYDTPLTREVTLKLFLGQMADFMAGQLDIKPPPPPGDLGDVVKQIDPETLAATILVSIFDAIGRGWKEGVSEQMEAAKQIGRYLHDQAMLHKLDLTDSAAADGVRLGRKPLYRFLKLEWGTEELVRAGSWMMRCADLIGYFGEDERCFPAIRPEWQDAIDKIATEMMWRAPVRLPLLSPPPDWTGWHTEYADGTHATFVHDWRPETKVAIEAVFAAAYVKHDSAIAEQLLAVARVVEFDGQTIDLGDEIATKPQSFEHAVGINALQRTPLKINQPILALVEDLAAAVKEYKAGRSNCPDRQVTEEGKTLRGYREQWRKADETTIKYDLIHAKYPGTKRFWLGYSCDSRGRLIPNQHLNYAREDHVRALFIFAKGEPIGSAVDVLEIHTANCWGIKGTWDDRIAWTKEHRCDIEAIADDPRATFNKWKRAGDPFQFVAACLELAAAWADPNFITHLPVGFDGSCSGIQHLSLSVRDEQAGKLVNLIATARPNDIYATVAAYVQDSLNLANDRWTMDDYKWQWLNPQSLVQLDKEQIDILAGKESGWSEWKKHRGKYKLCPLTEKQTGRLLKSFKAVSDGWAQWWRDRFQELRARSHNSGKDLIRGMLKSPVMTFPYSATEHGMADKIAEVHAELFGGMEPSPAASRYLAKKVMEVCQAVLPRPSRVMEYIRSIAERLADQNRILEWRSPTGFPVANHYYHQPKPRRISVPRGNQNMMFSIASDHEGRVDKMAAANSAAPNYAHSMDAAHLIRVVLGARAEGIDCLTVHDCFSCLAPHATRFSRIIRREMTMLYARQDHLAALGDFGIERPAYGKLDPLGVQDAEYTFS